MINTGSKGKLNSTHSRGLLAMNTMRGYDKKEFAQRKFISASQSCIPHCSGIRNSKMWLCVPRKVSLTFIQVVVFFVVVFIQWADLELSDGSVAEHISVIDIIQLRLRRLYRTAVLRVQIVTRWQQTGALVVAGTVWRRRRRRGKLCGRSLQVPVTWGRWSRADEWAFGHDESCWICGWFIDAIAISVWSRLVSWVHRRSTCHHVTTVDTAARWNYKAATIGDVRHGAWRACSNITTSQVLTGESSSPFYLGLANS